MPLYPFHGVWPTIAEDVFIAPGAMIIGDVRLGPGSSVWYNAVLRADTEPIIIGARTNIQDNAVVHVDPGAPCIIGEDCTLGHSAIVHAAKVGNRVLVGMRATVLSHSSIGDDVIIGAGSLVPEHKEIQGGFIVLGSPARAIRALDETARERVRRNAEAYLHLSREHLASLRVAGLDTGLTHGGSTPNTSESE